MEHPNRKRAAAAMQRSPWRFVTSLLVVACVAAVADLLASQEPPSAAESNNGTVGHAVLGGVAGGYGGAAVGTIVSRLSCPGRSACSTVLPVLATTVGVTLGSYAGLTDQNRAYGGMIGAGIGVLGGAVGFAVWSGVARISEASEPDPFTGLGMAILGGALGAIVGTAVSGSEDGAEIVDPVVRRMARTTAFAIPAPIRVHF